MPLNSLTATIHLYSMAAGRAHRARIGPRNVACASPSSILPPSNLSLSSVLQPSYSDRLASTESGTHAMSVLIAQVLSEVAKAVLGAFTGQVAAVLVEKIKD